MKKVSLNSNWEYVEAALQNPLLVNLLQGWKKTDLPHDYAVEKGRDLNSPAGLDEGFFQGAGLYYKKSFILSEKAEGKQLFVEFEGVSGFTEVWINKKFAAKHANPYTSFTIDASELLHVGENEIMLHTDSRMKPNSRWYVGAGLYRSVWLYAGEKGGIRPHGLKCGTVSLTESEAVLHIRHDASGSTRYELLDGDTVVASTEDGNDVHLTVPNPSPWSPDSPKLYTLRATVNGDTTEETVGIRTIEVSAREGLKLNGKPLKLKGGCIHHDLGILGSADYEAAERRRLRILKESGFNAVRLAHNPFGPAIFKACDELGMLCVEEAFDEWVLGRTSFGLHISFEDRWEKDLEDMIDRDYNHPCILMWGTGNEVEERDGSADGFAWSKRLAEKVRSLDATRPVTASACALFSEYGQRPADGTTGNQALNMAFDNFASGNDIWGDTTAPYFAPLDVAGYNYKSVRYAHDAKKFPERVIYGSESYPRATYQTWTDTLANPNVIGDFVWTAWDYLGEVGVGRWEVSEQERPSNPEWPWMTAGCSDIDFIGVKRPQSYYRDAVWGDKDCVSLFTLPPALNGSNIARLSWGWLPVEPNYSYPGAEGEQLEAHIYTNGDEVELLQNGVSLGRQEIFEREARFTLCYQPGTLTAVAYRDGVEIGRDELKTAGKTVKLSLTLDGNAIRADGEDLAFLTVQALDENGTPVYTESGEITVEVQGARLAALGTADPKPERLTPFTESTVPLYHGMALIAVRSTKGARGCLIKVTMGELEAQTGLGFTPVEAEDDLVSEAASGAVDLTLGELLTNEKAAAILQNGMGQLLNSPMLEAMKGMSLRKLMGMGGQSIPQELSDALDAAMRS